VTAILATADEQFRNRVLERLLAAGYDDLEVAELPAALAELLRESEQPLVVVGGTWPAPQAFLRVAVNAGALPLVLLESSALEAEGEALAMGARAALQSDIPASSLAAAMAAVDAGLIVLEPSARALLLSANRDRFAGRSARGASTNERTHVESSGASLPPAGQTEEASTLPSEGLQARRHGRPLTSREREILALVASGTSNKGVARALSVSANTVKFHLAAVFDLTQGHALRPWRKPSAAESSRFSRARRALIQCRSGALLHCRIRPFTTPGNKLIDPASQHRQRHRS
jgi:DNA-binding NarL/FixJ family response regulator